MWKIVGTGVAVAVVMVGGYFAVKQYQLSRAKKMASTQA
jgi:hypothetical protein